MEADRSMKSQNTSFQCENTRAQLQSLQSGLRAKLGSCRVCYKTDRSGIPYQSYCTPWTAIASTDFGTGVRTAATGTAYGFSLTRNYMYVYEKAHVYMQVSDQEAARIQAVQQKGK